MKSRLLTTAIFLFSAAAHAQVINYIIDSTSFNALTLDGGKVEAEMADLNGDGNLDIVTIGDHGSPFINTNQHGITVFFGNGTGAGWSLYQTGDFGYGGIAVGDLNNDRVPDVAYGMHHDYSATDFGDQLIEAALGDGTGMNWTPWDDSLGTNGENYGMFGTDVGDYNNDGWLDIVSNSFGCCSGVHAYENLGTGVWQQTFGFVNGNASRYIRFGDLNHDGNLDFVVCNQNGGAYFGDGNGGFAPQPSGLPALGNLGYYDVSLGDVDNDGDDDFAFVANAIPYVYKWNDATLQWVNISTGLTGIDTHCARLADLNSDGFMDLVTAHDYVLKVWIGNGGTSWNNTISYGLPDMFNCQEISIGDVDHNGFPELLTWADYYTGWISSLNKLKMFKETTIATAVNIMELFPKGFECFPNNAARFISWAGAVPAGHKSSVSIELSTTGLSGPWTVIDSAAANTGKYQWQVPAAISSYDCYFRFIVTDSTTLLTDTAFNDHPFQIGVCNPALGVNESNEAPVLISASPNPFTESVTIYGDLKSCSITIMDITGKVIRNISNASLPYTIDRGTLKAGMYIFEVKARDGMIARVKGIAY